MRKPIFKGIVVMVMVTMMWTACTIGFAKQSVQLEEHVNSVAWGQPLLVTLFENPTTGYQWIFEISQEEILEFHQQEFIEWKERSKDEEQPVGVGRYAQWEFRSLNPGFSQIRFFYVRSWEEPLKPVDVRVFNVEVLDQPGVQIFIDLEEKTNELTVGQTMSVVLEENPTTGYQWIFEVSDEQNLSFTGEHVKVPPKEGLAGAPRTMQWDFEALEPGCYWIHFRYYRSWEGQDHAIDERVYVVHVD